MSGTEGSAGPLVDVFAEVSSEVDLGGGEAEAPTMGTLQLDDSPTPSPPPSLAAPLSPAQPPAQPPAPQTPPLTPAPAQAAAAPLTPAAAAPLANGADSPLHQALSEATEPARPEPALGSFEAATLPTAEPKTLTPAAPKTLTPAATPEAAGSSAPVAPARSLTPAAPARKEKKAEAKEEPLELTKPGLTITIVEFEKKGEGMQAYVVYKIKTTVEEGVAGFTKSEYVVARRFSDFLGLHEKLVTKHATLGRIVPPPPEKSVVGTTKTKWSGQEEDPSASDFLERRKASLQRFLRRLVLHPSLLQDPDVRDFLTLSSDLPKATGTSVLSGPGIKKMFGKVGDSINKMAFRMEETDGWFEEKTLEMEELEECLRKLTSSVECLVHFRRELGTSTEAFCKAMSMLAACEENTALSRAFSQLAETQEKVAECQSAQAEKDFFLLLETLRDYLALIATVKEVLYERVKVWNRWQTAAADLNKKRELKTRLELAGKTDKLPQAKVDVAAAETKVAEAEEDFKRISLQIRKEMRRFDAQRVLDFKASLLEYLDSLAQTQQRLLQHWEAFLPEAKAIVS